MDPDAALARIREIGADIAEEEVPSVEQAIELAEVICGLDAWLSTGGFLPAAWAGGHLA